jgi:cytochrome c2
LIGNFNIRRRCAARAATGRLTTNIYLMNPRAMVPGTAMAAFPGIPKGLSGRT